MDDQPSDSLETSLRIFRIRQTEIEKEIRDDIAEMQDDLSRIVSEFTDVLTEKTEAEVTFTSCRISNVELQLRRLEETKSMISSFAGIFQHFNTVTSKILTTDAKQTRRQPLSQVEAGLLTHTSENGVETVLEKNLHTQRRSERSSHQLDDNVLLTETNRFENDEIDMIVASADRLAEVSGKKRNYLDVSDPDKVNITGKQNCVVDAHLKK